MTNRNLTRATAKIILAFVLFVSLLVGCYALSFPEADVRYRLTATFSVNDKVATGEGVLQVKYSPQPCFDVCGINARLSGEAIPIDFGAGIGTMWLLLWPSSGSSKSRTSHSNDPAWLFPDVFGLEETGQSRARYVWQARFLHGRRELAADQLPEILFLPDDDLPSAPPRLNGGIINFAVASPHFISAHVERTDEPVTRGRLSRLHWLESIKAGQWPSNWGGVNTTYLWRF